MSRKILAFLTIVFFLAAAALFASNYITGLAVENNVDLSVRKRTDIEITLFDFDPLITIYDTQNISVEIMNTGSSRYNASITEYVYNLTENSTLNLISTYVDSTVDMFPGRRRAHKAVFVPPEIGTYIIEVEVRYGSRRKEVFGTFVVVEEIEEEEPPPGNGTGNETGEGNGTGGEVGEGGTGAGGAGGAGVDRILTINKTLIAPVMGIEFPDRVIAKRNEVTLFSISVENLGKFFLNKITLHISVPLSFEIDFSPKTAQSLSIGKSMTYIVSILPGDSAGPEEEIEFEVTSEIVKREGIITVEVVDEISLEDLVKRKIANFEFLIPQVEADIDTAEIRGIDVSLPRHHINSAKEGLGKAKALAEDKEYEDALKILDQVEEDIKQAAFTLGITGIGISLPAAFPFLIILAVIVFAAFITLFFYYRRKRKRKRPRLLEKGS